jgi:hypothetical protein
LTTCRFGFTDCLCTRCCGCEDSEDICAECTNDKESDKMVYCWQFKFQPEIHKYPMSQEGDHGSYIDQEGGEHPL